MKFKEYQTLSERTCPILENIEQDRLHMKLGVNTEVGEFLDAIKKHIAYKRELDIINLGEEIGDIYWYLINEMRIEGEFINDSFFEFRLNRNISKDSDSPINLSDAASRLIDWSMEYNNSVMKDYYSLIVELMEISYKLNLSTPDILIKNINKLKVRFPEKFTTENALNRNLDKEREVL